MLSRFSRIPFQKKMAMYGCKSGLFKPRSKFLEPVRSYALKSASGSRLTSNTRFVPQTSKVNFMGTNKRWKSSVSGETFATPSASTTTAGTVRASDTLKADKGVAAWLFTTAASVFGMIVLGGVTRLTRSGLSMTDWRPQGSFPPMNETEWEFEFNKYKQFPEYQKMNMHMTVDEFKSIFYMEWGHRMWGRCIGLIFTVPGLYFLARGRIQKPLLKPLGLMFSLGATQGAVGWWMVKSGLEAQEHDWKEPRVSPYRLTAHLSMAFTIYSLLVYTGMTVYNPNAALRVARSLNPILGEAGAKHLKALRTFHTRARLTGGLICVTAFSGAFVAGNDAGHAYNSFPKMGDHWIPPEVFDMDPWWKNVFENTALVQLDHRILAISTMSSVLALVATTRGNTTLYKILPRHTKLGLNGLGVAVCGQVALGITTLLLYVPVSIAAAHQAGAMILWTVALGLIHNLKYVNAHRVLMRGRGVPGLKLNQMKAHMKTLKDVKTPQNN